MSAQLLLLLLRQAASAAAGCAPGRSYAATAAAQHSSIEDCFQVNLAMLQLFNSVVRSAHRAKQPEAAYEGDAGEGLTCWAVVLGGLGGTHSMQLGVCLACKYAMIRV